MSRMWEGDRTSKGGRRAGGDQFPSRQGGLSCGQAPAMHATGAFLVHTGHPVTRQLKDLPHSGGTTILCDWSQALPAPEMSTANSTWRGTLTSCAQQYTQPWPHACPLPYHHGHVLLLDHLPSCRPHSRGHCSCLQAGKAAQTPAEPHEKCHWTSAGKATANSFTVL